MDLEFHGMCCISIPYVGTYVPIHTVHCLPSPMETAIPWNLDFHDVETAIPWNLDFHDVENNSPTHGEHSGMEMKMEFQSYV